MGLAGNDGGGVGRMDTSPAEQVRTWDKREGRAVTSQIKGLGTARAARSQWPGKEQLQEEVTFPILEEMD